MKATRIEPGLYELRHGRGVNKRTFEIRQEPTGWAVRETNITFMTIRDGWTLIAYGLPTKKAAMAAAEAEL